MFLTYSASHVESVANGADRLDSLSVHYHNSLPPSIFKKVFLRDSRRVQIMLTDCLSVYYHLEGIHLLVFVRFSRLCYCSQFLTS